jgi:membrane dipeptidase
MIDCHCDALWKIWEKQYDFYNHTLLDVNYCKWMKSDVNVQCFAIFIPATVPVESKFAVAIQMVDIFFEQIIKPYQNIKWIQTKTDIENLKDNEKGAMLTLEGLDCIGNDLFKLRILIQLGVRMIGLSWNNANLMVDGIKENRGAGLTNLGKEVIKLANKHHIWIDLAHCSTNGFEEAIDLVDYPIVSHANARQICNNIRNLTNEQIKRIIYKKGLIGITFVKEFVIDKETATIDDLIAHIQHLINLGAMNNIVIGSDFDGADYFVQDLTSIHHISNLKKKLNQHYPENMTKKIYSQNFLEKFPSS